MNDLKRFWSKVQLSEDGCWQWTANKSHGYGQFELGRRPIGAHRYAYQQLVGPIPEGLQLDHLCRNRACVNPQHLEPVTQAENKRRGIAGQVNRDRMRALTQCRHGHPFDQANTYWRPDGHRACKTCRRAANRRWIAKNST